MEQATTQETATARLLLERCGQERLDTVQVSTLLLWPKTKNIFLEPLIEACTNTSLALETFVPQPIEPFCGKVIPHVHGVSAPDETSYVREALSKAKGDAIWLVESDGKLMPSLPQALYTPLMENDIVSARPSFPPETDCLPQPMNTDTLALAGEEIIYAAAKKQMPVLPHISAALFKRESLQNALDGIKAGPLDLEQMVRGAYLAGHVALVPFPYIGQEGM